ncbi:MAG: hypothetical protein Q7T03_03735 [Deltaproteobacteria bacterium]|nr:hypothetical protein [Deltaproteobacteria bacterium]
MKKILFFIAWAFLLWCWTYNQKMEALKKEIHRGELLTEVLTASNIFPLEHQSESLLTLAGVDQRHGVRQVFVVDAQGKIVLPLEKYGEKIGSGVRNESSVMKIEKPIVGANGQVFGKAVILFEPEESQFYLFWLLLLFPPVLAAGLHHLKQKQKRETKKPVDVLPEAYPWLPVFAHGMGAPIFVFDEEGHILGSSEPEKPKHILDLFMEAEKAQRVLGWVHELKSDGEKGASLLDNDGLRVGMWRQGDAKKNHFFISAPSFRSQN